MKSALFALFCLLATALGTHAAVGTAYGALELIEKQRGAKTLDQVTEVRGVNGSPQPKEWVVSVSDADARGGVRQLGVMGGKIVSERTPAGRTLSPAMNLNQLNLDSDGAQTIADREAKKASFAYDYIDYVLHAGTRGGAPVWELNLVDGQSGNTATLILAADKGTILSTEGLTKAGNAAPPPPDEDPRRQANRGGTPRPPSPQAQGNFFQRAGNTMNKFFNRVGDHMERRGRQIGDTFHNAFSDDHRDTSGPHHPGDEDEAPARPAPKAAQPAPPRTNRDPKGTDYTRPRD